MVRLRPRRYQSRPKGADSVRVPMRVCGASGSDCSSLPAERFGKTPFAATIRFTLYLQWMYIQSGYPMNHTLHLVLSAFLLSILSGSAQVPEPLAEKWFSRFPGAAGLRDIPTAIATDAAGDVYVAAITEGYRVWKGTVLRFAADSGALLWRWESLQEIDFADSTDPAGDARIAIGPDGNPIALFRHGNQLVKLLARDGSEAWSVATE